MAWFTSWRWILAAVVLLTSGMAFILMIHAPDTLNSRIDLEAVGIPGIRAKGTFDQGIRSVTLKRAYDESKPIWEGREEGAGSLVYRTVNIAPSVWLWFTVRNGSVVDVAPYVDTDGRRGSYLRVLVAQQLSFPDWAGTFQAKTIPGADSGSIASQISFRYKSPDFFIVKDLYELPKLSRFIVWCPAEQITIFKTRKDWYATRPVDDLLGLMSDENSEKEQARGEKKSHDVKAAEAPPVTFNGLVEKVVPLSNRLTGQRFQLVQVRLAGLLIDVLVAGRLIEQPIIPNNVALCTGVLYGTFCSR